MTTLDLMESQRVVQKTMTTDMMPEHPIRWHRHTGPRCFLHFAFAKWEAREDCRDNMGRTFIVPPIPRQSSLWVSGTLTHQTKRNSKAVTSRRSSVRGWYFPGRADPIRAVAIIGNSVALPHKKLLSYIHLRFFYTTQWQTSLQSTWW